MSLYSQMSTALSQQWDSPGSAKQTLPCGDRNGRKGQSRTGQCREIVCFLVMQTRIRSELYVCVCVCLHVEVNTSDCRAGNTIESPSFTRLTWEVGRLPRHVWMCSVYVVWFGLLCPGWVDLSVCLGAEIQELLNIPGSSPSFQIDQAQSMSNSLVALGGQGAHFTHFPSEQLCRLRFHRFKANTQSKWYEGF